MGLLNLILLPILAAIGLFETTPPGGDGDAAEPAKGDPAKPSGEGDPAAAKPDAKDDEPLGEGGKRALEEERRTRRAEKARADKAEAELTRIREANQTEQEKAVSDAKKAGATERDAHWQAVVRESRIESALAAAGCTNPHLAARADEFGELKVTDTGAVEGLDEAVTAFKDANKTLFTARVPSGSFDQGARPPADKRANTLDDALQQHYAPAVGAARTQ